MRNLSQNAPQVAEVAIALAARLRALAEDLERVDQIAAVSFVRETDQRNGYLRTTIEISLVEEPR